MILVWSMTVAAIWKGCNYQNGNFPMGSQTKGRRIVIFPGAPTALIQAMCYHIPHKHYHIARLRCASLEWEKTKRVRHCVNFASSSKTWVSLGPKASLRQRKAGLGKGKVEKWKVPSCLALRKVVQWCTFKKHLNWKKEMWTSELFIVKKIKQKNLPRDARLNLQKDISAAGYFWMYICRCIWNICQDVSGHNFYMFNLMA